MTIIITIIFFTLGLIIGSFLNVIILRYNTFRSLGGRSSCMVCEKSLTWHELIPLFSFFILRGRCKTCKTKISIQYPLVEIITGLVFATLFLKFSNIFYIDTLMFAFTFSYYSLIFSILIIICVYDIRHKIIPDILVFILIAFSFVGMFFFIPSDFGQNFYPHIPRLLDFLGASIVAIFFATLWLISHGKWMGFGDAKLALGLGFFLGTVKVLSSMILSFWIGALWGILFIFSNKIFKLHKNKLNIKSEIPFAPFLVLGSFLVFIFNINFFPIF